jgi:hypothetical protein
LNKTWVRVADDPVQLGRRLCKSVNRCTSDRSSE